MATADIHMQPFMAARLQRLSEVERTDELTRVGLRIMKSNNLMRWDGFDIEFATDLAERMYLAALARIERATRHHAA